MRPLKKVFDWLLHCRQLTTESAAESASLATLFQEHERAADMHVRCAKEAWDRGNLDDAARHMLLGGREREICQDWRQIAAMWQGAGFLFQDSNRYGHAERSFEHDYLYRNLVIGTPKLADRPPLHLQAWAFQWAAQHGEHAGSHRFAMRHYLRAAEAVETWIQPEQGESLGDRLDRRSSSHELTAEDRWRWAGDLWTQTCLTAARMVGRTAYAPLSEEETTDVIDHSIKRLAEAYSQIEEKKSQFYHLAVSYRAIRSTLAQNGDSIKAEEVRRKEARARARYYWHSWKPVRASFSFAFSPWAVPVLALFWSGIAVWCAFMYRATAWLEITRHGANSVWDFLYASFLVSLAIDFSDLRPESFGKAIVPVQTTLSYVVLAVLVSLLLVRLERWR